MPKRKTSAYPTVEAAIDAAKRQVSRQIGGKNLSIESTGIWSYPGDTFRIIRFNLSDGDKAIRPIHLDDGWRVGDPAGPLPLYRVDEIPANAEIVFVTEGEKCADLVLSLGLPAVTSSHGAGSAEKTDWQPLIDTGKTVVILRDNDAAGDKYARSVADIILKSNPAAQLKILLLPDLPDGGDIEQFIEARDSMDTEEIAAAIMNLVDASPLIGTTETRYTEQSNAQTLVHLHGTKFRFLFEQGKYLLYDDATGRWSTDSTGQVTRWAKEVASLQWAYSDGSKESVKHATQSESARGIAAMMKLAQTEPGITVLAAQMDANDWHLNCTNGVVNLKTGRLIPHAPGLLISKLAPVRFDPSAECPIWNKYLNRIVDGKDAMISYLQRLAGLMLTGDVSVQEMFIFYGSGSNGKSVWCDTVLKMLGDYAGIAADSLLTSKGMHQHPTEIADLDGRRAVFASETEEDAQLKIQLVKRMTGDAKLKGRLMRQDFYEFHRKFKLVLSTNSRPKITENTHAVWRRLRLIPFDVVIAESEKDEHLLKKLELEFPGILAWAVRGCLDWQKNGMQTPEEVMVATADYQRDQDVLSDFISSRCKHPGTGKVSRGDLFTSYLSWANQVGEKQPLDRNALFARIRRLSDVSDHQWKPAGIAVPVRGFIGICLQD